MSLAGAWEEERAVLAVQTRFVFPVWSKDPAVTLGKVPFAC